MQLAPLFGNVPLGSCQRNTTILQRMLRGAPRYQFFSSTIFCKGLFALCRLNASETTYQKKTWHSCPLWWQWFFAISTNRDTWSSPKTPMCTGTLVFLSPLQDKLSCFTNAIGLLENLVVEDVFQGNNVESTNESTWSKLLTALILKASPPNLYSNLEFTTSFRQPRMTPQDSWLAINRLAKSKRAQANFKLLSGVFLVGLKFIVSSLVVMMTCWSDLKEGKCLSDLANAFVMLVGNSRRLMSLDLSGPGME